MKGLRGFGFNVNIPRQCPSCGSGCGYTIAKGCQYKAARVSLKDHEIAQIVNQLRDIAVEFSNTQQLRNRIHSFIVPILRRTDG